MNNSTVNIDFLSNDSKGCNCILNTFFSLRSSIGELAVLDVASPSKKHSLVISSWEEREELRWGSTWRSERKWTE